MVKEYFICSHILSMHIPIPIEISSLEIIFSWYVIKSAIGESKVIKIWLFKEKGSINMEYVPEESFAIQLDIETFSLLFSDAFSEISNIVLHIAEYYIMFYEMHTPFIFLVWSVKKL